MVEWWNDEGMMEWGWSEWQDVGTRTVVISSCECGGMPWNCTV